MNRFTTYGRKVDRRPLGGAKGPTGGQLGDIEFNADPSFDDPVLDVSAALEELTPPECHHPGANTPQNRLGALGLGQIAG